VGLESGSETRDSKYGLNIDSLQNLCHYAVAGVDSANPVLCTLAPNGLLRTLPLPIIVIGVSGFFLVDVERKELR
jgi:hypothetical protein